jgi:hypothetical protein
MQFAAEWRRQDQTAPAAAPVVAIAATDGFGRLRN